MAAPTTGDEFLALLEQSQLLEASVFDRLKSQLAPKMNANVGARKLAVSLIKSQILTEYHAKQLLAARYKGFYIGKFKILELLGVGGMGKVYLCEQITMQRLVAVKVVRIRHQDRRKEILARFTREARAVAALSHPNIIHAYDFDEEKGTPYIVMEYVEGIDTARLVGKFGAVKPAQAAEFIRQAAEGLKHAHEAGLVHRDIKPGNLLVDTAGVVKLLDLGLCSAMAADADDSLTVDQDQLGTVDFIAPEQAMDSHNADARADIYGLGATLYSLITGNVLYPNKSTTQKLMLHQTEMPTPIRKLVPEVPEGLAKVIERMLQKSPDDRYQTAGEVIAALDAFAQPVKPPYDVSVINYPRSKIEPYMKQSPDPSSISVAGLATGGDSDIKSKRTDSGKVQASSRISLNSPEPESQDVVFTDEMSLMEIQAPAVMSSLPPRSRAHKKPGKSKKKSSSGIPQPVLIGVSAVAALLLIGFLSTVMFKGDAVSKEESVSSPSSSVPSSDSGFTKRPGAQKSRYPQWKAYSDDTDRRKNVLLHYRFEQPFGFDRLIKNRAAATADLFDLTVAQARWVQGRFPEKGALSFGGQASKQYASLTLKDSKQLSFQTPQSLAIWFRVDRFNGPLQTLMAKSNTSWRLHRLYSTSRLAFEVNSEPTAEQKKSLDAGEQYNQTRHTLKGQTAVDDGEWHLVIVTLADIEEPPVRAKDDTKTAVSESPDKVKPPVQRMAKYRMYLDGKLDGHMSAPLSRDENQPVWLGANGDHWLLDKENTVATEKEYGGTRNFFGQIDEVLVWDRTIHKDEIERMYDAGRPE